MRAFEELVLRRRLVLVLAVELLNEVELPALRGGISCRLRR